MEVVDVRGGQRGRVPFRGGIIIGALPDGFVAEEIDDRVLRTLEQINPGGAIIARVGDAEGEATAIGIVVLTTGVHELRGPDHLLDADKKFAAVAGGATRVEVETERCGEVFARFVQVDNGEVAPAVAQRDIHIVAAGVTTHHHLGSIDAGRRIVGVVAGGVKCRHAEKQGVEKVVGRHDRTAGQACLAGEGGREVRLEAGVTIVGFGHGHRGSKIRHGIPNAGVGVVDKVRGLFQDAVHLRDRQPAAGVRGFVGLLHEGHAAGEQRTRKRGAGGIGVKVSVGANGAHGVVGEDGFLIALASVSGGVGIGCALYAQAAGDEIVADVFQPANGSELRGVAAGVHACIRFGTKRIAGRVHTDDAAVAAGFGFDKRAAGKAAVHRHGPVGVAVGHHAQQVGPAVGVASQYEFRLMSGAEAVSFRTGQSAGGRAGHRGAVLKPPVGHQGVVLGDGQGEGIPLHAVVIGVAERGGHPVSGHGDARVDPVQARDVLPTIKPEVVLVATSPTEAGMGHVKFRIADTDRISFAGQAGVGAGERGQTKQRAFVGVEGRRGDGGRQQE